VSTDLSVCGHRQTDADLINDEYFSRNIQAKMDLFTEKYPSEDWMVYTI